MFSPSKKYLSCFDYLDSLRKKGVHLSIKSPLDMPSVVARNHLKNKYYALRLSKIGVIVNEVASVECQPQPLSTIYLFGPDLLGEKEAVLRSGFFLHFPQDWDNVNGHGWSSERLGLNAAKISELASRFDFHGWLQEAAERVDQLATKEIIRLTYDFVYHRSEPNGSMRAVGLEAFSKVAINTISRNFMRAKANGLMRDGLRCTAEGIVTIHKTENDLNEGGFSNEDCFKIGPSNNLLMYLAIHFLNVFGWRANIRTLSYLLACRYLRSKTKLKEKKKLLKQSISPKTRAAIEEQILFEQAKTNRLEKLAFKFVKRSVDSLIEQNAVAHIGNAYLVLGNKVQSSFGKITVDPYQYSNLYLSTLQDVREIHQLTKQKGPSKQSVQKSQQLLHRKPRIYIASTCHDFRDLRQEAAKSLREWGYRPLLNEDSDFPVEVGVHSYQACLEAVKQSDCLVLIIGTRYGGEVENSGISITELEYRTACENGIPRINFCLDSVWNLIQVRQKNPNLNYPKYFSEGKEKADKIFRFLDLVRKHELCKTDNWVHRFKNSVELKEILRERLRRMKLRALT